MDGAIVTTVSAWAAPVIGIGFFGIGYLWFRAVMAFLRDSGLWKPHA